MNKKGAELSMNVIIIAAIALIVLVILAVLVLRAGGKVNEGTTTSCISKGGLCKISTNCQTGTFDGATGCGSGEVCCKVIG
jgi:hypothetical protein